MLKNYLSVVLTRTKCVSLASFPVIYDKKTSSDQHGWGLFLIWKETQVD